MQLEKNECNFSALISFKTSIQYWSCACTTGVIKSIYVYSYNNTSRKRFFSMITVVLVGENKCVEEQGRF